MVQDWRQYKAKECELDFTFWSWKNWLLIGTGLIAVCALLLSLSLGYRLRAFKETIATMQLITRAHATPIKLYDYTYTVH